MKTDLIGTVPRLFLEIDWPSLVQSKISPFNPAPTTNFPFCESIAEATLEFMIFLHFPVSVFHIFIVESRLLDTKIPFPELMLIDNIFCLCPSITLIELSIKSQIFIFSAHEIRKLLSFDMQML